MRIRFAVTAGLLFAAGPSLAATATAEQRADLIAVRDQMVAAIQPCDQKIGDLTESLENLRVGKAGTTATLARGVADEADRVCGLSGSAFSTMRIPTSVDAAVQAKIRTAGQKWVTAMSARRRAVSVARDYLQKSDKATGQLYLKRLEAAQAQVAEGAELLKSAGKDAGVDLMK
ncbi:hypothetical protein [Roseiterribacter gracilis]|uniref:Uncharacterized protein n=1 Tax=Roseiterribacter gracilis TaxID=2812848 RepID=A0A8S8XAQ1_9PROT|nr:hypothetical protein TMPK1_33050 [Rhodospirillales bacterium TMPK1]